MTAPVVTLTSCRSRIGSDEHGLRHRVLAVVREREQEPVAAAAGAADLLRASAQDEHGRLPALAAHLELAPVDTQPQPGAERLEARFLGGEARSEVLGGVATGLAVGDLAIGEDAAKEALLPTLDDAAHSREMDEIDADAANTRIACRTNLFAAPGRLARRAHAAPIRSRMMAARSPAIVRMRSPSAPSIITPPTHSVPK